MAGYQWAGDKVKPPPRPRPVYSRELPDLDLEADARPQVAVPHLVMRHSTWPADLVELTARELQVVKLIALGKSNIEVGKELFLSEDTIKSHIRHITIKMKARGLGRAGIVGLCFRYGVITPEELWPGDYHASSR